MILPTNSLSAPAFSWLGKDKAIQLAHFNCPVIPVGMRWQHIWEIGKTRLTAQVNVNNILDKEYYKSGQTWTRLRIPAGEPLGVLGSLRLEF